MNDSNTAAELRNDLGQMKRDSKAETMRPLIYDRAMEILVNAYANGDSYASEVLGEAMNRNDQEFGQYVRQCFAELAA